MLGLMHSNIEDKRTAVLERFGYGSEMVQKYSGMVKNFPVMIQR